MINSSLIRRIMIGLIILTIIYLSYKFILIMGLLAALFYLIRSSIKKSVAPTTPKFVFVKSSYDTGAGSRNSGRKGEHVQFDPYEIVD